MLRPIVRHASQWALLAICSVPSALSAQAIPDMPLCSGPSGPQLESKELSYPARGAERSVEVGAIVMSAGRAVIYENGLIMKADARVTAKRLGSEYEVIIPAGEYSGELWIDKSMTLVRGKNAYYRVPNGTFRFLKQKTPARDMVGMFVDPEDGVLNARIDGGFSSRALPIPDAQFERRRCMRRTGRGLQSEVIYTGSAKGVITLQYREFQDDIARPAFSQDYTF